MFCLDKACKIQERWLPPSSSGGSLNQPKQKNRYPQKANTDFKAIKKWSRLAYFSKQIN